MMIPIDSANLEELFHAILNDERIGLSRRELNILLEVNGANIKTLKQIAKTYIGCDGKIEKISDS